jgi:hypothetical protein
VLLGALNSLVLSLAMAVHPGEPASVGMASIVLKAALIIAIPGVVIGAFAGALAGRLKRHRIPALVLVPCTGMAFVVLGLLGLFLRDRGDIAAAIREVGPVLLLALIPTALVLERWTRPVPELCAPGAIARRRST